MKLIESSVKILEQEPGLEGVYKMAELAGRTAYKSEDKITEGSAKRFVEAMMKSNHGAVLEHGTVYLYFKVYVGRKKKNMPTDCVDTIDAFELMKALFNNPYSRKNIIADKSYRYYYITTNFRVLYEANKLDFLKYICEPTEYHEKRITAKFICSRSIAQEITRHRVFSFLMESQRYVAYNREKFGGEITYIIPEWVKDRIYDYANSIEPITRFSRSYILDEPTIPDIIEVHMLALSRAVNCWYESLKNAESDYMYLVTEAELKAEEARGVLPNDCKTELVMTGFISDWEHFFDLRARGTTGKPHPDIKILADNLLSQFNQNNLL